MELTINQSAVAETLIDKLAEEIAQVDTDAFSRIMNATEESLAKDGAAIKAFMQVCVIMDDAFNTCDRLEMICKKAAEAGQNSAILEKAGFMIRALASYRAEAENLPNWSEMVTTFRGFINGGN